MNDNNEVLQQYREQYPVFMNTLVDQHTVPYIPTNPIKNPKDLTDADLTHMYIPGSFNNINSKQ